MQDREYHWGRLVIAILYCALAVAYSVVNPAFESPDEMLHFEYVQTLLRDHRLPVAQGELNEYHQPPLYYAVGALLTSMLPVDGPAGALIERNPFWAWRIGEVGVDNKSQFLHSADQDWPYRGPWLRLHILRLFSIASGLLTVLGCMALARALWLDRSDIPLLAGAFVAFLPQFLFLSSSVTNDVAVIAASTLTGVAVARFLTDPDRRLRWALATGMLIGCGLLCEVSMLLTGGLAMGVIGMELWLESRDRAAGSPDRTRGRLAKFTGQVAPALVLPLLIAGPWLWRNLQVYGDPTGLAAMDAVWGRQKTALTLSEALPKLANIWTSFWARFGYGQIPVPNPIYLACLVLVAIAVGGAVWALWCQYKQGTWSRERWLVVLLAALMALGYAAATIQYSRTSLTGDFGRFLFIGIGGIALFLALGWITVGALLRLPGRATLIALTAMLVAFSLWALLGILRPAYVLATDTRQAPSNEAGYRLGDVAIIRKITILNPALEIGDDALVQVEWEPLRRTTTPLIFVAQLLGPEGERLGDRHSYPGLGRVSTTNWQPGKVFTDLYRVPVESETGQVRSPAAIRLDSGFYDRLADRRLPVYDLAGGAMVIPPLLGEAKLLGPENRPAPGNPGQGLARIGGALRLDAVQLPFHARAGTNVTVTLDWTVLQPVRDDCKLYLHMTPPDSDAQVAQVDEAVLSGRYPAHLWAAGERFEDRHELTVPADVAPGLYSLHLGMYCGDAWWEPLKVEGAGGSSYNYELGMVEVSGKMR